MAKCGSEGFVALSWPNTLLRTEWTHFLKGNDMYLTGEGLSYLLTTHPSLARRLLPHAKVFARVNPKHKDAVVTILKALGYTTLMCGDGTNNFGALNLSNVGVAIISGVPVKKKKSKDNDDYVNKSVVMENDKFDKLKNGGKGKRLRHRWLKAIKQSKQ